MQRKLSIGASNDPLEQEADRVADHVLAAPTNSTSSGAAPHIQRYTGQASPDGGSAPASVDSVLASPGRPLDPALQQDFGQRFGHDFSHVRIHADAAAAQSARDVNAHAYTVGQDIVFGAGQFAAGTHAGQRLLAHELTHVVQQSSINSGLAGGVTSRISRAPALLQRLGANPTCTKAEADGIHQAIYDARGWLNKVIPRLEESPLSSAVLSALRRNFGPTYGVAANAPLIQKRLKVGRSALGTIPFSCDTAGATKPCVDQQCGWTVAGSNAATICTNAPSTLSMPWPRAADCVLHESLHASMSFMTVDNYKVNPGYPGAGKEPLLNAESYTHFVMELS
ncbi:MAG TPA: DUF4157 domain-containing protein [Gallionella sp.]|nr:DUF4157 domain-containing protein [Gallionella sp.]